MAVVTCCQVFETRYVMLMSMLFSSSFRPAQKRTLFVDNFNILDIRPSNIYQVCTIVWVILLTWSETMCMRTVCTGERPCLEFTAQLNTYSIYHTMILSKIACCVANLLFFRNSLLTSNAQNHFIGVSFRDDLIIIVDVSDHLTTYSWQTIWKLVLDDVTHTTMTSWQE